MNRVRLSGDIPAKIVSVAAVCYAGCMTPENAAAIEANILLIGGGICGLLVIGTCVGVVVMLIRGKR